MRYARRAFLAGAGGVAIGALGARLARTQGTQATPYVSCGADRDGRYLVGAIDPGGTVRFRQPLPARGHGAAFRPGRPDCVIFARRPGEFAAVLDTATGGVLHWIGAAPGRHFYGHGAFSADGSTLFASENDFGAGRGVLGIYDAKDSYKRVGEVPSHGVGPHEVRLMPDGETLVVANGGIQTHPARGRAKLNLETMVPNLAYLGAESGRLLQLAELPEQLHKLSIRHLDLTPDEQVAIALQYEGDRRDRVPLVGLYRCGGEVRLLPAPAAIERRMRHYTGSIAFDASGAYLAVSSPRGHVVTLWDAKAEEFLGHIEALDASGVAATGAASEFLVTGGDGAIRLVDARSGSARVLAAPGGPLAWDNHVGSPIGTWANPEPA